MGKIRNFESFPPLHRSLLHFFIRDKETDEPNSILSLNRHRLRIPPTRNRKSKMSSVAEEDGQRQLQAPSRPGSSAHSCQQLFGGQGGCPARDSWKESNPSLCHPTPESVCHIPAATTQCEERQQGTRHLSVGPSPAGAQKVVPLRIQNGKDRWQD